jgi:hypothetical protein
MSLAFSRTIAHSGAQLHTIQPAVCGRQQQVRIAAESGAEQAAALVLQACVLRRDVTALKLHIRVPSAADDHSCPWHGQLAAAGQREHDWRGNCAVAGCRSR